MIRWLPSALATGGSGCRGPLADGQGPGGGVEVTAGRWELSAPEVLLEDLAQRVAGQAVDEVQESGALEWR